MRKNFSYAVLLSVFASMGMMSACGDNETDRVTDTGEVTEAPTTQSPSDAAPAPSAVDPAMTTTPPPAGDDERPPASGADASTAPDITPEPDSR